MNKPALIFYWDDEKAPLYRTFSHMNPELYIEAERVKSTINDRQKAMNDALLKISTQFWPPKINLNITEVSSLFPDVLEVELGELDSSKKYPERQIWVNGFRFRIWQETTNNWNFWGQIPVCKIQPIFDKNSLLLNENELNLIANQLHFIPDTKRFLKNRAWINSPISNKEWIFIRNVADLQKWIQEMFLEYRQLSLWHTFESIAQSISLRQNYGFLVWLVLHYKKSLQK